MDFVRWNGWSRVGCATVACAWLLACAADPESDAGAGGSAGVGVGATGGFGGAAGMAGAAGSGGTAADSLCLTYETKACSCVDGRPGRSICSSAAIWSLCDCGDGAGETFDPSLNPPGNSRSDIRFDWEATESAKCEPGRYEGTFTCTYVAMGGDPSMGILVTGPIVMTLMESENGEFLEITNGKLDGNTGLIINFTSALSGRLNCATREFGARAEMGLWGPIVPVNPFDGVLEARYDDVTSTLSGTWALNEMLTMGICAGPWNARRVGP